MTFFNKLPVFRLAVMGTLVAVLCYILVETDGVRYRYQKYPCHYHYIYDVAAPADVVFLGTSRSMMGISPNVVSAALANSDLFPARSPRVFNLSRASRGREQMRLLANDVMEQMRPKLLAVEFYFSRKSFIFPRLHQFASVPEMLTQSVFDNRFAAIERVNVTLGLLVKRWLQHLETLSYRQPIISRYPAHLYPEPNSCRPKDPLQHPLILAASHTRPAQDRTPRTWDLEAGSNRRNDLALKRLIEQARTRGGYGSLLLRSRAPRPPSRPHVGAGGGRKIRHPPDSTGQPVDQCAG